MSGALDEMKISQHKDMSFYLTEEQQYIPEADFEITHHDWAYFESNGVIIPTPYTVIAHLQRRSQEDTHQWLRRNPDSAVVTVSERPARRP
jgi:hypothetical protein